MTGLVDSVSYLALGNVFVANMTGNIIFLGFGIAGTRGTSGALTSAAFFCAGAATGGHLAFHRISHRGLLLSAGTALQACALITAALIVTTFGHTDFFERQALIAILAASMGWQYAIVRRLKVPDFRTIVITTTLTALVADTTQPKQQIARRTLSITALLLGAAIGPTLIKHLSVAAPLWASAAILITVATACFVTARRTGAERWG